jgi:hypothetical protein
MDRQSVNNEDCVQLKLSWEPLLSLIVTLELHVLVCTDSWRKIFHNIVWLKWKWTNPKNLCNGIDWFVFGTVNCMLEGVQVIKILNLRRRQLWATVQKDAFSQERIQSPCQDSYCQWQAVNTCNGINKSRSKTYLTWLSI